MAVNRIVPPEDYLKTASRSSLESFELAHLNIAANLRREISVLVDQWIEETAEAMLARWMLEHPSSLRQPVKSRPDLQPIFEENDDNPRPDDPRDNAPDNPTAQTDIHSPPTHVTGSRHLLTGTWGGKSHK